MSFSYIKKQEYYNQDLALIINVNPKSQHLKRDIQRQLKAMGLSEREYTFTKKGYTTILWIPETYEDKIRYLCRLMGIDSRVNFTHFALFIYSLLKDEEFQCKPWAERAKWLEQKYQITVSERTLYNWLKKLITIDPEAIQKDNTSYKIWSSYKDFTNNNKIIREEVSPEEQQEYKQIIINFYDNEENKKLSQEEQSKRLFQLLWAHFGRRFYKCYAYVCGAWKNELLTEIINLTQEYVQQQNLV